MDDFSNPFRADIVIDPDAPVRIRRFRRKSRNKLIIVAAAVLLFGTSVYLLAKPTYHRIKIWRATRLVEQAEKAMESGAWTEASQKAYAAYLLVPLDVRNLRVIANVFSKSGSDRSLEFWQKIVQLEPQDIDARHKLISTALRLQRFGVGETQAQYFLSSGTAKTESLLLIAELARAQMDYARELQVLRRAEALTPGNSEIRFRIQRCLVRVGSSKEANDAIEEMRRLASKGESLSMDAIEALVTSPAVSPVEKRALIERLKQNREATAEQIVTAFAAELSSFPSTRRGTLDELQARLKDGDLPLRVAAARLFLSIRAFDRVIEAIPLDLTKNSEELAFLLADALSQSGKAENWEKSIPTLGPIIRPELKLLCEWQVAQGDPETKNDRDARLAVDACGKRVDSLAFLGARFEELQRPDLALLAFKRLQRISPYNRPALFGLLRIAHRQRDTVEILRLLEGIQTESDRDAALRNELAYFRLLLRRDVESNKNAAKALTEEYPERVVYRATYALGCLRNNEAEEALRQFEEINFNPSLATVSTRAIYAAALIANGRSEFVSAVVQSINRSVLLPEEQDLLFAKKLD